MATLLGTTSVSFHHSLLSGFKRMSPTSVPLQLHTHHSSASEGINLSSRKILQRQKILLCCTRTKRKVS